MSRTGETVDLFETFDQNEVETLVRRHFGLSIPRLRFSREAVETVLRAEFENVEIVRVEGFTVGGPNELYHVVARNPDHEFVLKVIYKGTESGLAGYMCAREAYALSVAATLRFTSPALYAFYPDGGQLDRPYLVISCLDGDPLALNTSFLSSEKLVQIGRQMGEAVRQLHSVVFDAYGDLPVPDTTPPEADYKPLVWGISGELNEVVEARIAYLLELYVSHGVFGAADRDALASALRDAFRSLADVSHPTLAHMDLEPKNILVATQDVRRPYRGLADFDRALALPAEADLAVMMNRWELGASAGRRAAYPYFKRGFFEGYRPAETLGAGWEDRAATFFALESLERLYVPDARDHLRQFVCS